MPILAYGLIGCNKKVYGAKKKFDVSNFEEQLLCHKTINLVCPSFAFYSHPSINAIGVAAERPPFGKFRAPRIFWAFLYIVYICQDMN